MLEVEVVEVLPEELFCELVQVLERELEERSAMLETTAAATRVASDELVEGMRPAAISFLVMRSTRTRVVPSFW